MPRAGGRARRVRRLLSPECLFECGELEGRPCRHCGAVAGTYQLEQKVYCGSCNKIVGRFDLTAEQRHEICRFLVEQLDRVLEWSEGCFEQLDASAISSLERPELEHYGNLRFLREKLGTELQSRDNRKRASGSRRKAWAEALACELRTRYGTFPEAWEAIPEDDEDGLRLSNLRGEIYREGDSVYYTAEGFGDERLNRESFRTGYFVRAK